MSCKYCNTENKDLIFETKYWIILLADDQYDLGRCVIILKRHCDSLSKLKIEEIIDFLEVVKKLENTIKKSFNATMFNWSCLMNNAYKSNNPNPHIHWHLRPRYKEKVKFDNITFEDLEFAHHYDNKKVLKPSQIILNKIILKIKENL